MGAGCDFTRWKAGDVLVNKVNGTKCQISRAQSMFGRCWIYIRDNGLDGWGWRSAADACAAGFRKVEVSSQQIGGSPADAVEQLAVAEREIASAREAIRQQCPDLTDDDFARASLAALMDLAMTDWYSSRLNEERAKANYRLAVDRHSREVGDLRRQIDQVTEERDSSRAIADQLNDELGKIGGLVDELLRKAADKRAQRESRRWKPGDVIKLDEHSNRRIVDVDDDGNLVIRGWSWSATQEHLERTGWKLHSKASDKPQQEAELSGNPGELPAESYQWQVGDVVEHDDGSMNCTRPVTNRSEGWVFLLGDDSGLPQPEWERRGWKLFRKASDLGVQQLTPRQVEISDSTGTDGEGQS